jgi:hypothetical protein
MRRRFAPRIFGVTLAILLAGCSTLHRVPADGLYAGELCTAVMAGPLDCGAADVFLSKGRAKVGVSDFIYDLALEDGQVEVMLVHGRTLVDVWSASYSWDSPYLRFIDEERRTFYRVRFANPAQSHDSGRKGD